MHDSGEPKPPLESAATAESVAEPRSLFGFRFIAPLALGSTLLPLNSSLIATSMVPIADSFGVTVAGASWLITGLYLAMVVAQPTMGKLADLVGARRVFVGSLALAAAAGTAGALAPSLGFLVATRVLLGIGISGAYPSAMRMFRDRAEAAGAPPPRTAMGVLSLSSWSIAAAGPALGGLLTGLFDWRAVFAINTPLALCAMLAILRWSPADGPPAGGPKDLWSALDVIGLTLFTAFLLSFVPVLMHLSRPNGFALAMAVVFAAALGVWSWRRTRPFIDVRMLATHVGLTATYVRFSVILMISYCIYLGFAQWAQAAAGYSPAASGLLTLPMSIVAAGGSFAAARVRSLRTLFVVGCASALAGSLVLLNLDHTSPPWALAGALVFFGLPFGMASTATQIAVYIQSPRDQIGVSSGLQRTFGYFGSIVAASLLALFFGAQPTDSGLHLLMVTLVAASALTLAAVALDPSLPKVGETR